MIRFDTTRFGELEVAPGAVLHFPEGLLGFPGDRRFVLLEHGGDRMPLRWLQSLDTPALAFIVIDPWRVEPRFRMELDGETAGLIGAGETGDCTALAIVSIAVNGTARLTANLKAPLLIGMATRVGRQVILGSAAWSLEAPLTAACQPAFAGEVG